LDTASGRLEGSSAGIIDMRVVAEKAEMGCVGTSTDPGSDRIHDPADTFCGKSVKVWERGGFERGFISQDLARSIPHTINNEEKNF
jgi:hypothetical protein